MIETIFAFLLPISIAGVNIGLGALTIVALISHPKLKQLKQPVFYALLAYIAAAFLSAILSSNPSIGLKAVLKDAHKIWALSLFLLLIKSKRSTLLALGAGYAVVSIVGIAQTVIGIFHYHGPDLLQAARIFRAHAFVHPVTYGEQIALALLGAICFYGNEEAGLGSKTARWTTALFIFLCALALLLNMTRAAWVSFLVGVGALCLSNKKLRPWLILAPIGAVPFFVRSRHWSAGVQTTLEDRPILWKVAWQAFRDHPWLGVGPGQYKVAFARYYGTLNGEVWGSAHNLYLHQLAERGVIGLGALSLLLGLMTWQAFQGASQKPTPWRLWAFASLVAFLIMNLTEVAFQVEQVATLVLFIWALAIPA